ncbi:unnamed protein product [Urochloa decumbens]|uniref:F-box/LRR-repeat protein 15/At3g58940/PEG3-like LRR domain-containing protein n=1 Tax=Urochloa decumbens TaxID=240449 RepID=A0ABC9F5Z1_9POAL
MGQTAPHRRVKPRRAGVFGSIGRERLQMEPSPPAVAAEAADLLFSLPAHLLDGILGRLARHPRRRPHLRALPRLAPQAVDRVLLRYTGPRVPRFSFTVDSASASHVDHWLVALSRRRVESISIYNRFETGFERTPTILRSYIFSCAHLVSLNLEFFIISSLPVGFAGLHVLEELYLSDVEFADDGERHLQAIIHGSPLLRVLYLSDVDNPAACVIEAPNFHSLTLRSTYDFDWRFGELPCLQYASIDVSEPEDLDFRKFLARLSQVRELTLWLPGNGVEIGTTPFTFYNLKSLELSTYFWDMDQILLMFSLLRSFPNLEKLTIEVRAMVGEETEWEFLSAQWTDGMCANLQVVEICSCCQGLPISFMKLILSKASHLRTLSVDTCPVSQDDPLNKLLKCRRASAQAQVLFKVQLEGVRFNRMYERMQKMAH